MPFEDSPELELTRESMQKWLNSYGALVIVLMLLLVWFFSYAFTLLSAIFFVLFMSLVALLAGRVWKLKLEYSQWLAVGFHAITLPTILDYLFIWFGLQVPFMMPVVFFMFIFAVLSDERARPVKPKPKVEPIEK